MEMVRSADGTAIAVHREGSGSPVVLVGGAFSTAAAAADIAQALAAGGFEAFSYDRRARGDSGDTRPYLPSREVDDLAAVIGLAGGSAVVVGHSSGAVLTHFAAAEGVSIAHAFLSEPSYRFGQGENDDLADRLQRYVDDGRPELAVRTFQMEAVGLPEAVVDQIAGSPMFPSLVALAQSVVYDTILTSQCATPSPAMLAVSPVTILRGEQTFPFIIQATDRLAGAMPQAELVVVPESRDHGLDGPATARIVRDRVG